LYCLDPDPLTHLNPDPNTVGNMEHEPGEQHTRMIFLRVVAQQLSSLTRLPDSLATVSWLTHRSSCPNCNHIVATVREGYLKEKTKFTINLKVSSPTRLPDSLAIVSWLTDRSSCPNCNHIVVTVREGNIGKKSRHFESDCTVRRGKRNEDFD
jgi:hypothetical protein